VTYFVDDLTQLFDPTKSCTKDFLKMLSGQTVNQGFYLAVSQNLQKAMRKKWPEIWKRRLFVCLFVCLFAVDYREHSTLKTKTTTTSNSFTATLRSWSPSNRSFPCSKIQNYLKRTPI
jgi:hypothetical protein